MTARPQRVVDARVLWLGGLLAAGAAAVLVMIETLLGCLLFCHAIGTLTVAVLAALAAIGATGLMHLFLVHASRPERRFGDTMVLVTTGIVVTPFAGGHSWVGAPVAACVYILVALTIGFLVAASARGAVQVPAPAENDESPETRPSLPAPYRAL